MLRPALPGGPTTERIFKNQVIEDWNKTKHLYIQTVNALVIDPSIRQQVIDGLEMCAQKIAKKLESIDVKGSSVDVSLDGETTNIRVDELKSIYTTLPGLATIKELADLGKQNVISTDNLKQVTDEMIAGFRSVYGTNIINIGGKPVWNSTKMAGGQASSTYQCFKDALAVLGITIASIGGPVIITIIALVLTIGAAACWPLGAALLGVAGLSILGTLAACKVGNTITAKNEIVFNLLIEQGVEIKIHDRVNGIGYSQHDKNKKYELLWVYGDKQGWIRERDVYYVFIFVKPVIQDDGNYTNNVFWFDVDYKFASQYQNMVFIPQESEDKSCKIGLYNYNQRGGYTYSVETVKYLTCSDLGWAYELYEKRGQNAGKPRKGRYENMTIKELKSRASARKIKVKSGLKKSEIIELLRRRR